MTFRTLYEGKGKKGAGKMGPSMVVVALAVLAFPVLAEAGRHNYAFDISNDICGAYAGSSHKWDCLSKDFGTAIIQAWRGGYGLTSKLKDCLAHAQRANMTTEVT
jgi:hypothetical protein